MNYGFPVRYETRVHVLSSKPTAATIMQILKEHDDATDTQPSEWEIDIERKTNEVLHNMVAPTNRYRWEVTLTRRFK